MKYFIILISTKIHHNTAILLIGVNMMEDKHGFTLMMAGQHFSILLVNHVKNSLIKKVFQSAFLLVHHIIISKHFITYTVIHTFSSGYHWSTSENVFVFKKSWSRFGILTLILHGCSRKTM